MQKTNFLETQTILRALEYTSAKGGFATNARQKQTAGALIKNMKAGGSASGRYRQLMTMLKKGATLAQLMKAAGSSRRTIFRYLNHFEDAGVKIVLEGMRYRTDD